MRLLISGILSAAIALSGISAAFADVQNLDCNSVPGGYLCRQSVTLDQLVQTTCTGAPCEALFRNQADAADAFTTYFNQNVFGDFTASADIGAKVSTLAKDVCGWNVTGDASDFSNTVDKLNALLLNLRDIQVAAKLTTINFCTLTIN